jgi:CRP-like cAMP-binding protein
MATVSPTIKSQLLSVAPVFKEPKRAVLFRRNEPAFGIFLICKGSVSLRLEAEDGTSGWDRTAMSDSIVGLAGTLSGNRYSLTAVVSEDAELAFLGRGIVLDLIKNDANVGLGLAPRVVLYSPNRRVIRRYITGEARQPASSATL